MRYEIIQSGSDGNCTIVDGQIAIDMGVPFYKIEHFVNDLRLVLLTHAHGDHFRKPTVKKLAKMRPTLKWACRDWMAQPLRNSGVDPRNIILVNPDKWVQPTEYGCPVTSWIAAFDTAHDTLNCGWRIWRDHHDCIFYATDLATLDGIQAKAYTVYLLEANYRESELEQRREAKLEAGEFSYETRAETTHLSWEQTTAWLQENMAPWSTWVPMHEHKEREAQDGRPQNADPESDG